ncbi:MAG: hypothetical protein PVG14_19975 [Anaerolineales bacterium]
MSAEPSLTVISRSMQSKNRQGIVNRGRQPAFHPLPPRSVLAKTTHKPTAEEGFFA